MTAVADAVAAIAAGGMAVVSGEGTGDRDVVAAAELVTPRHVNFMATHARGLVSVALTAGAIDRLGLPAMAVREEVAADSPFLVTIEAARGVSTGISAADRATTLRVAADARSGPADLVQPGHVLPLRARAGGVLRRAGRSEAAVDLVRLAGLQPAAALCQVLNDDGTMPTATELRAFAARHELPAVSVAELVEHLSDDGVGRGARRASARGPAAASPSRRSAAADVAAMIEPGDFRAAVGCFASGVTVITLREPDGSPRGFTANAFSSLSLAPPLVLVCLDHRSESYPAMSRPGVAFAVNVLARGQEDLALGFAGKGGSAKFDGIAHVDQALGVPVLDGALAVLECFATETHEGGDHDIVVGEVRRVAFDADAEPLVFYRGTFGELARPEALRPAV